MPRAKLTKTLVLETVPSPTGPIIIMDSTVRGFGVRIHPTGKRVFFAYYRNAAGQERRPNIGEFGVLSVEQARDLARQLLGSVAAGADPSAVKQAARRGTNLQAVWDRYIIEAPSRIKPSTLARYIQLWQVHIAPAFARLPLSSLTRGEIAAWHQRKAKNPATANHALSLLRMLLNRAIEWEVTNANPTLGIRSFPERRREMFLTGPQLRTLLTVIAQEEKIGGLPVARRAPAEASGEGGPAPTPPPGKRRGGKGYIETTSRGISSACAGFFRLLIFTGARHGEILTAEWSWIDWKNRALRLPDSKTGRKAVWLNALAIEELRRLHDRRTQEQWIIEGKHPGTPLDNPDKAWRRLRAIAARASDDPGFLQLRLHDLRHSFASIGAATGVPLYTIGKALGHTDQATTQRYAHLADNPVRDAADAIGKAIASLLEEKPRQKQSKARS